MVIMPLHVRPSDQCSVCHSTASLGYHFGALTCAACCAFFRRFVLGQKSESYKCRKDSNNCGIRDIRQCKICRFQECIRAGMNPNQLAFAFDGTPGDSTLREMWNSKSMVNIAEASRLFRNLRFSKLQKCNPNIQSGASTSDSSYSFEMYKEMVWEERDSAHLFISKLKLFEGLSPEDQAILHAEFMKAWLPYMFGVWTAMNNGAAISRCYTSPNTYFELNVDVLRSLLITNFSDVKPYVPFDFDSMGKQFYAIICHHLRQIAPLFRVEDSDVDLAIQLIFILLNSGRDLSGEGRSVIQNAANQLFRELHKYCNMRKVDFAEKTGDLLSLYHKISEGTRLFNEILCTMQVHCGPDHFFYLMPKRIRKMWACPMKTASLPSSPDLDSH